MFGVDQSTKCSMVVILFKKLHSASCPIKMAHQLISFICRGMDLSQNSTFFSCEIGREHFINHISYCAGLETLVEKIYKDQLMTKTKAIYSALAIASSQSSSLTVWQRLKSRQRSGVALYRKKKKRGKSSDIYRLETVGLGKMQVSWGAGYPLCLVRRAYLTFLSMLLFSYYLFFPISILLNVFKVRHVFKIPVAAYRYHT